MISAPYEKEFIFHSGQRAKNISELGNIIEHLSFEEFQEFVNSSKNDFANWIEFVLMDKFLAGKLRETTSKDGTLDIMRSKIRDMHHESKNYWESHYPESHKENESQIMNHSEILHKNGEHENTDKEHFHRASSDNSSNSNNSRSSDHNSSTHVNNWYTFFKQKNVSEKHDLDHEHGEKTTDSMGTNHSINKEAITESSKESTKEVHSESHNKKSRRESSEVLWIIIYGVIVALIILLIVYKFILNKSL